MVIVRWILALTIGGFLIFFGLMKFTGGAHIFPYIEYKAASIGVPLAEIVYPYGNYVVGAVELVAGALLILPMTRAFGAKLAVLPFLGATAFHVSPLLGVKTPDSYADPKPIDMLATGGPFARSDFSEGASITLFTTAIAGLVAAIVNVFVQQQDR